MATPVFPVCSARASTSLWCTGGAGYSAICWALFVADSPVIGHKKQRVKPPRTVPPQTTQHSTAQTIGKAHGCTDRGAQTA